VRPLGGDQVERLQRIISRKHAVSFITENATESGANLRFIIHN